jgi:hypothetical protein
MLLDVYGSTSKTQSRSAIIMPFVMHGELVLEGQIVEIVVSDAQMWSLLSPQIRRSQMCFVVRFVFRTPAPSSLIDLAHILSPAVCQLFLVGLDLLNSPTQMVQPCQRLQHTRYLPLTTTSPMVGGR